MKTATPGTLSPRVFSLGQAIVFEDLRDVIEAQNYATEQHVQRADWQGIVRAQVTTRPLLRGWLYVPSYVESIGFAVGVSGGTTLAATLTVGAGTASLTTVAGTNSGTIARSAAGQGILQWTLVVTAQTGDPDFTDLHLSTAAPAATLPDPGA
ncbi:MAG: hypothetical protein AAF851_05645 [Myxococcota bacterium]